MLNDIQSKAIEIEGQIDLASMALEDRKQSLAEAHLYGGDLEAANAAVVSATADLEALHTASGAIKKELAAAEASAMADLINERTADIKRLSKAYEARLNKAEEHLCLMMAELSEADEILQTIRASASLPALGEIPGEWRDLLAVLKDPYPPVAVAAAVIVARENRVFGEHFGRALSSHKTASVQCAGRTMSEMAVSPIDVVSP
jgi:hypothetical protein